MCAWEKTEDREAWCSAEKSPNCTHQHKSITILRGATDLKYNKLSQKVLCVATCVCGLHMFHDLNTVCDVRCRITHSCVCACLHMRYLATCFNSLKTSSVFVGSMQHFAASAAAYFLCPAVIGDMPMTFWTALSAQCYRLFPEVVLPFRAISKWLEIALDYALVQHVC